MNVMWGQILEQTCREDDDKVRVGWERELANVVLVVFSFCIYFLNAVDGFVIHGKG